MMTATGPRWSAGGSVDVTRSCLGMVDTSGIALTIAARRRVPAVKGCRGPIARIQQDLPNTLVDHAAWRGTGPGICALFGGAVRSGTGLSGLVQRRYDLLALTGAARVCWTDNGVKPLCGIPFQAEVGL